MERPQLVDRQQQVEMHSLAHSLRSQLQHLEVEVDSLAQNLRVQVHLMHYSELQPRPHQH